MGLWLKVHREVAGAWRSACYDMYRHANRRRAVRLRMAETAEYGPRNHRGQHVMKTTGRHRAAATTGVALLVAGGAAGTYLAVAGSLAALAPGPYEAPVAAPAAPATSPGSAASQIHPPAPQPTQVRPQVRRTTPPQVLALPEVPGPADVPAQPTTDPESTPTSSPSTSPSPSASPSPSVSSLSPSPSWTKRSKWGRSPVGSEGH
ncbi:hypothetical protein ACQP1P_39320 [Dactylosporangium sp. CA-052675]|uniref:hypothetical protein n=1 Tax=Dactylosporangium sp. CA-052675 TaxID=3239927 RepID=UPI003D941ABF